MKVKGILATEQRDLYVECSFRKARWRLAGLSYIQRSRDTVTDFEQVVEGVVTGLRDLTPRETVELGVLHGFCVDAAREAYPHLLLFLSSVEGLNAFSAHLSKMTTVIEAVDASGSRWRFVEATGV